MGTIATPRTEKVGNWVSSDILFLASYIKVEVQVPTSDPLIFPSFQRRRYGCKLIDRVEPAGTRSVYIYATDCTAVEAANEYLNIVNKHNNATDDDETEEV